MTNKQQPNEEQFPAQSQKDNVPDKQQEVTEPTHQRHENRENPRKDHGTGHLGYNRTHLDTNPGPVVEGSDKI